MSLIARLLALHSELFDIRPSTLDEDEDLHFDGFKLSAPRMAEGQNVQQQTTTGEFGSGQVQQLSKLAFHNEQDR